MSEDFKLTIVTAQAITALHEELKERFPNTLPTVDISGSELRYLQGQQKIIDYIGYLLDVGEED
jgi:hypothetical protein